MKNNKGFTLIELLVVIVILLSISIIAVPNINKSLSKRRIEDLRQDQETILRYVETYASSNPSFFNCLRGYGYVNLSELVEKKKIKLRNTRFKGTDYDGIYAYTSDLITEVDVDENNPRENCLQYID